MKIKKLLVPAALVLGVGAILTRKRSSDSQTIAPLDVKKKKHSSLRITNELLQEYLRNGGVRIILEFVERSGYIKLRFYGFTADDSICIQEDLETIQKNALNSGNIYYGSITKDDRGRYLHDLIANVLPADVKDWVLTPVKYKDVDERYVSYDLAEERALTRLAQLNPSPPALN